MKLKFLSVYNLIFFSNHVELCAAGHGLREITEKQTLALQIGFGSELGIMM
jgi:hypothetical protein